MPRKPRDKFFHAINDAYDGMLAAIEAANNRGYKVSRTLLKEARKGERELVGLARKWTDAPTNYFDFFESVLDVQARAQTRTLELARDFLGGAGGYRGDVQEAMTRVVKANREAGEATVEALRDAYERSVGRIRGGGEAEEEVAPQPVRPPTRRPPQRRKAASRRRAAARRPQPAVVTPVPVEEESLPAITA